MSDLVMTDTFTDRQALLKKYLQYLKCVSQSLKVIKAVLIVSGGKLDKKMNQFGFFEKIINLSKCFTFSMTMDNGAIFWTMLY
jgi:hypothetical protein